MLFVLYAAMELLSPYTHIGFYIEDGVAHDYAHDIIYLIWYVLYIAIIVSVVVLKNKTIISRIYISVVLTMAVSVFITISEYHYNTESFTVLSYYIPILSVVLLFHSNSYNSNFGAVDRAALVTKLTALHNGRKDFVFVNIEIPDFDKSKLGFEITESVEADDFNLIRETLSKFKELGITIYLDDFGTGFSNIEHIAKMPIDIIKFDRSLVLSSKADKKSENIVSSLSNMFNIIGCNILYESIEDGNDENRCIKLKAHYLQGFMYSEPIPIEQMSDFIGREYTEEISF